MNKTITTIEEIERSLREIQARNVIPRYICYWADGSVTQGDSSSPVFRATTITVVQEAREILVGYLIPHGQFFIVWDPQGSYTISLGYACAYAGEEKVNGLNSAIEAMKKAQVEPIENLWATLKREGVWKTSSMALD